MTNITKSASNKITTILTNNPKTKGIRLEVKGGGCAGFMYNFSLVDEIIDGDIIIENKLYIDPFSQAYLKNATVDYENSLEGDFLTVKNPDVSTACGCGLSFN